MEQLVAHFIKTYDEAEDTVLSVGETLQNYQRTQGQNFDAEVFCIQFDCILQYFYPTGANF